jgi:hypothetical protein
MALTDEEKEKFRAAVTSGEYSMSQIARMFNMVSVNAAIGRAHRMGISNGRAPLNNNKRRLPEGSGLELIKKIGAGIPRRPRGRPPGSMRLTFTPPLGDVTPPKLKLIAEWDKKKFPQPNAACFDCINLFTQCKWPIRDEPVQFCGELKREAKPGEKLNDVPYCDRHSKMAKQEPYKKGEQW